MLHVSHDGHILPARVMNYLFICVDWSISVYIYIYIHMDIYIYIYKHETGYIYIYTIEI